MSDKYKAMVVVIVALMIVSSCARADMNETGQGCDVAETIFQATLSEAEEVTEPVGEISPKAYVMQSGGPAEKYCFAVKNCEEFIGLLDKADEAQMIDLNGDGTPEIILSAGEAAVFSFEENGEMFRAETEEKLYLTGDIESYLTAEGESIFLAKNGSGKSSSGHENISALALVGGKLEKRDICGWEYEKDNFTVQVSPNYYFGDKGKKISEEEYKAALENYMRELSYSGGFSYVLRRSALKEFDRLEEIYDGLKLFCVYADSAEQLDGGLSFDTERKLVSSWHNDNGIQYYHYHFFDAAGNEIYYNSNYWADRYRTGEYRYRYTYRTDGSIESFVCRNGAKSDVTALDEYGNKISQDREYEYDSEGRLIRETVYRDSSRRVVEHEWKYSYNSDGTPDTEEEYVLWENTVGGRNYQRWRYVYEDGRTLTYYISDQKEGNFWKEIYGTDYESGTEFFIHEKIFDKSGNITRETTYAPDGRKTVQFDYRYDKNGNLIYKERSVPDGLYEPKDSIQEYVETMSYDDDGNMLTSSYEYWQQKQYTSYEYDEGGNVIAEVLKITGADNEMDGIYVGEYLTEYSYVFDLKGGIIKRETRGYSRVDDLEKEKPELWSEAEECYQPVNVVIVNK